MLHLTSCEYADTHPARVPSGEHRDLWMRSPSDNHMHQISDGYHDDEMRRVFLQTYLQAGWTDPEFRPERVTKVSP